MMQFGMPTLIENHTLEENIDLCSSWSLTVILTDSAKSDHTIDIVTMM